jgi:uncharacterized protein (DUF58 family)
MPDDGQTTQLTALLSNEMLTRLGRLRINASRRFTNRSRGEHLSGKGGRSIEFADYRDYTPGDDVRFVDWNVFSRLHRPYLKLYYEEEVMHVALLVDASSSMLPEGKLEIAKRLAAAFAVVGLFGTERVSVYAFNEKGGRPGRLAPRAGRGHMGGVFRFIEGIEGGGDSPVELDVESFLSRHTGRGVAVLLSDFLTFGDLRRALNLIFGAGLEIFGVQILGPSEIDPELGGDVRLVDCETVETLDVSSAGQLLGIYQEYRQSFERELEEMCRRRSGRFRSIGSDVSLDWLLFDDFVRTGWLG